MLVIICRYHLEISADNDSKLLLVSERDQHINVSSAQPLLSEHNATNSFESANKELQSQ